MTGDEQEHRRNYVFAAFNLVVIVSASVVPRFFDLPSSAFLPLVTVFLVVYAALAYALLRFLHRDRTS